MTNLNRLIAPFKNASAVLILSRAFYGMLNDTQECILTLTCYTYSIFDANFELTKCNLSRIYLDDAVYLSPDLTGM